MTENDARTICLLRAFVDSRRHCFEAKNARACPKLTNGGEVYRMPTRQIFRAEYIESYLIQSQTA